MRRLGERLKARGEEAQKAEEAAKSLFGSGNAANMPTTELSDEDLEKIMIIIDVKDNDGNYTHKFSITIPQIAAGVLSYRGSASA